jgi:hypothetical protein
MCRRGRSLTMRFGRRRAGSTGCWSAPTPGFGRSATGSSSCSPTGSSLPRWSTSGHHLLLVRLWEILRGDRVERPSIDRMIRLVAWARERAHKRTFERLAPQLTDPVREKLDGLLVTQAGRCGHAWLRTRPTSVSTRALGRELEKRAFLIDELGSDRFDLDGLPPNGARGWRRPAASRPIRRSPEWRPSGATQC